jgi:hypothetical protein
VNWLDKQASFLAKRFLPLRRAEGISSPVAFFLRFSGPHDHRINQEGKKKGTNHESIDSAQKTTPIFPVAFALACFALSPAARAVVPAPDGGYPNGNTAEGDFALDSVTTGSFNTALGNVALFSNTDGEQNTATGAGALFTNTLGNRNTANGLVALFSNTEGGDNTAVGWAALFSNTIGVQNTANGTQALALNTTGSHNTATGFHALFQQHEC